jgi:hypothetical protein
MLLLPVPVPLVDWASERLGSTNEASSNDEPSTTPPARLPKVRVWAFLSVI